MRRTTIAFVACLVAIGLASCGGNPTRPAETVGGGPEAGGPTAAAVPAELAAGAELYGSKCAECHGPAAEGTTTGPPFIHPVYVSSHHGDESFVYAALNGVAAHHWEFGDMPPVEGATEPDVRAIVGYVRWMQAQHGIH